jgi:hypothetical protein
VRQTASNFWKLALAMSVGGPIVGLLMVMVVRPGILAFAALTFTLPFLVLGAYVFGLVPAFLTSVVFYFAGARVGRFATALITAVAAAGFTAAWLYWLLHHAHGQQPRYDPYMAAIAATASLVFSLPKWDAREATG